MVNAQKWLFDKSKYNTKEKRRNVELLFIGSKKLENKLDLSDFTSLKSLRCDNNELTKLDLSNCHEIKEVYCQKNYLKILILPSKSNITYLNINSNLLSDKTIFEKLSNELVYLDIRDNKFAQKDLSFLSKFTELEVLKLGRKRTDISFVLETVWSHEDRHLNSFGGSFEPLKNMYKLDKLSIFNTDIGEGLGLLPLNLKKIRCGTTIGRELAYKCSEICRELKNYYLENDEYDLEKWRKVNPQKVKNFERPQQVVAPITIPLAEEEALNLLNEVITKIDRLEKGINNLRPETEEIKNNIMFSTIQKLQEEKKSLEIEKTTLQAKADNWDKLKEIFGDDIKEKLEKLSSLEGKIDELKNNLENVKNQLKVERECSQKLQNKVKGLEEVKSFLAERCKEMEIIRDAESLSLGEKNKKEINEEINKFKEFEAKIEEIKKW